MKKKLLIISLIVVTVLGVLFVFNYKSIKQTFSPVSAVTYAIPIDAGFILQSNDLYELLRKTEHESVLWDELLGIEEIKKFNTQIAFLDSLFRLNLKAKEIVKSRPFSVSTHLIGEEALEFLFLLSLPETISPEDAALFITEQVKNHASVRQKTYNDSEIFELHFNNNVAVTDFAFTVKKGILILSASTIIVENAVRQLDTQISLLSDKGFKKIQKTAGQKVDANIFINYKEFPRLIRLYGNKIYSENISAVKNIAEWSELDISVKKDAIMLNGFSAVNDSSNNYLSVFLNQSPQSVSVTEILPASTSAFIAISLSDAGRFNTDYRKYLEFSGQATSYHKLLNKVKKESDTELEKLIYNNLDKEFGVVFTEADDSQDYMENVFGVIKTKNKTQAEEEFVKFLENYAAQNDKKMKSLKSEQKFDEQTIYPIYTLPYPEIMKVMFGSLFSKIEANFFTFIDNYIVFAKTENALGSFLHYKILQKTLNEDKNYKQFTDNITAGSNFYFYSNIARSASFFASFCGEDLASIIIKNTAVFQKFQALAFQFSSMNDMVYNNVFVKYNPVYKDAPKTLWETKIDTISSFRPVLVDNFSNDEKCIITQDEAFNVYFINSVGNKKWKVNVKEKINSEIFQLDFFKNKKTQFLFSTRNYIYIVDILGNSVKNFPLKLRSPATNGISLVDFEKKKNYRLYIAGEDKKIYAYSREGNIIKEWEFKGTDSHVKSKIQNFRFGKKDIVVFSDARRTYITDKKGKTVCKPDKDFFRSANNIFYKTESEKNEEIVTTDTNGTVFFIDTEGNVREQKIKKYTPLHYFVCEDMNGDENSDFIFADKNIVETYKSGKKLIYTKELEGPVSATPVVFRFTKKTHKTGVVSSSAGKIYLLNSNGSVYNGFPLAGKTMFSIGYFTKTSDNFNLIVGGNENFIYNYEIK